MQLAGNLSAEKIKQPENKLFYTYLILMRVFMVDQQTIQHIAQMHVKWF